LATVA